MRDKRGTNYRPRLEIVDWVERPDALVDEPLYPQDRWVAPKKRSSSGDFISDEIPF
jgi:hypothetical protein